MMTVMAVAKLSRSTKVINAKNKALQVTGQTVTLGLTLCKNTAFVGTASMTLSQKNNKDIVSE